MKRILPLLLLVVASCKKATPEIKCYECEMKYADDTPAGKQYPCTADLKKWKSTAVDNSGRPMQAVCTQQ